MYSKLVLPPQSALPLSSILFRGGKSVHPQCPPRLDLQILKVFQWSRAPISSNKVHVLQAVRRARLEHALRGRRSVGLSFQFISLCEMNIYLQ